MAKSAASPLSNLSVADLERELRKRERSSGSALRRLNAKRDKLLAKLSALDAEIRKLGGSVSGAGAGGFRGRRRAKNDSSLVDALVKLLTKKTLSVSDAAEQVQKAGYVTTSPNFRTIVNQTLIKDKRFKRVGRGLYTVK